MLALPYDVLDSLVSDPLISKADLKSLSLVCKGFVRPYQQKLYEHVSPTQGDKCAQLYDTLSASPHISTYIKHLEVESDFHNPHLPRAVKKAGKVQSLMLGTPQAYSIPGPGRPTQQAIWAHMPHKFIEAIEHILQLPSLTSLSLNHWTFPSHSTLANLLCLPTNQLDILTLYTTIFGRSKRSTFPPRDDDTHTLKAIERSTKKPVSPLHLAVAMKGGDPRESWELLEHIFVEPESDSILDLSWTTSFTFAATSMQEEELAEAVVCVGARALSSQATMKPSVSFHANTAVSCLTIDYSNGGYAAGLSRGNRAHEERCPTRWSEDGVNMYSDREREV
ncbi:hypothetical protein FA13DRAFT_1737612 [Coprinellus micaceus]|uniref:Uncharacterized protein n=1 Tax=Coprinellus micaceus TaxID=71717 RepID=A0A4Y7SWH7_COPMI|nr:hypothetical protein FA13DRAFT_1737612 [Coprinellus micaceus]